MVIHNQRRRIMGIDPEFEAFQAMVWKRLPKRKWLAGRDRVYDCISIMVQEWPDEEMALAEGEIAKQWDVVRSLTNSVKRHLHLAYGEQEFGFIWTILLQALLHEIVALMLEWWRERKENRMTLLKWQRKWRSQE